MASPATQMTMLGEPCLRRPAGVIATLCHAIARGGDEILVDPSRIAVGKGDNAVIAPETEKRADDD